MIQIYIYIYIYIYINDTNIYIYIYIYIYINDEKRISMMKGSIDFSPRFSFGFSLMSKLFKKNNFFYLRGCPGQFARTTTNPTVY
jgi:hypothetical protein